MKVALRSVCVCVCVCVCGCVCVCVGGGGEGGTDAPCLGGHKASPRYIISFSSNAPINVKSAGGQGMGWGFDCLCYSWDRAFD